MITGFGVAVAHSNHGCFISGVHSVGLHSVCVQDGVKIESFLFVICFIAPRSALFLPSPKRVHR